MNQCPRCSYSLEGLPEDYVCPECGLAYHGETTFLKVRPSCTVLRFLMIAFGATTMLVLSIAARHWNWGSPFLWFWMIANCVVAVLIIIKINMGKCGELIIDRNGLSLNRPGAANEYIKMTDIKHARSRWWSGRVVLFGWDGRKMLSLSSWELNGPEHVTDCAHQINRHVEACLVRSMQGESYVD